MYYTNKPGGGGCYSIQKLVAYFITQYFTQLAVERVHSWIWYSHLSTQLASLDYILVYCSLRTIRRSLRNRRLYSVDVHKTTMLSIVLINSLSLFRNVNKTVTRSNFTLLSYLSTKNGHNVHVGIFTLTCSVPREDARKHKYLHYLADF